MGWWWWHVLRLLAYLIVLVYFFSLFKQQQDLLNKKKIELNHANKNLERRVLERTNALQAANQAKSEFLSNVSHELRTPLNAILGFSQILELDKSLSTSQKSSINEILSAGDHLLHLINQILDLSKIEEGIQDISSEDTDVCKIIFESISTLSPLCQKENIKLTTNITKESEFIITIDGFRLKQILINLISNAIKYNKKDGNVYVNIETIDNKVRISVKDTGQGLTKEQQEKVFNAFERLGRENGVIEGTGIGLVISKKLVKLMNGTIGVKSKPPEGSTFYIEFPCAI